MAQFFSLASSSAGNSTYIGCAQGGLLVDAGISCRRMVQGLAAAGVEPQTLRAILITHEHIDHIKGLRVLQKKTCAAVCATAPVLDYLCRGGYIAPETEVVAVTPGQPFAVGDICAEAFCTPHDSVGSVGYRLTLPGEQQVAVATDMGQLTDAVERGLSGCDLVLIEANYDPQLLRISPYPGFLKQRIASPQGHLPNDSSAVLAQKLVGSGTARLVLGHLSRENNNPALARQTVLDGLLAMGAADKRDFLLDVAPYDGPGPMVRF